MLYNNAGSRFLRDCAGASPNRNHVPLALAALAAGLRNQTT